MPELPEVETIIKILKRLVNNKTIASIRVYREKTIENDISYFKSTLQNQTIQDITRVGKYIIFHLTNDFVLISHLRMEGKFFLKNEGDKHSYHDLVDFVFTDGTYLTYNDTRRFGTIILSKEDTYKTEAPINRVGPDPFMLDNSNILVEANKNRKISIKTALLDQSVMSGLGNIYVDEVLFACKIHPETPANLITKKQFDLILKNSKEVLDLALKCGGSTIKSYHPQEGVNGNFQVNLKAYGKEGQKCPNCGTTFKKIFVNGRGTTFCPKCQRNIALPYILGVTGPIGCGKSTVSKYLETKGYIYISCDEMVHALYKDKEIQKDLVKIFPSTYIKNGDIDRPNLKKYIIENPTKKRRLENFVFSKVEEQLLAILKKIKSDKKVVVEAPMLFESHLDYLCDDILYIDIDKEKQIANLKNRNSDVINDLKLNSSFNDENKNKSSIVILNNEDLNSLYKKLNDIICK